MTVQLQCARCAAVYPTDQVRYECDCGGLLDVSHDLEALPQLCSTGVWMAFSLTDVLAALIVLPMLFVEIRRLRKLRISRQATTAAK